MAWSCSSTAGASAGRSPAVTRWSVWSSFMLRQRAGTLNCRWTGQMSQPFSSHSVRLRQSVDSLLSHDIRLDSACVFLPSAMVWTKRKLPTEDAPGFNPDDPYADPVALLEHREHVVWEKEVRVEEAKASDNPRGNSRTLIGF